nr:PREDICTED: fibroblast growth factor 19-like [Notothenia coriiceps]
MFVKFLEIESSPSMPAPKLLVHEITPLSAPPPRRTNSAASGSAADCHGYLQLGKEPIPNIQEWQQVSGCVEKPTYSRDSCTFREQILPDGYSVYTSVTHGALLSLGTPRQRKQGRDRGMPALAQFLPRVSSLDQVPDPGPDVPEQLEQRRPTEEPVDAMDLFGQLSKIMHSPSFHKR